MKTQTHVAGPGLIIGGRTVQRCAWCGFLLCDSKGAAYPLREDEEPPGFPVWEVGAYVEHTEGNPTAYRAIGRLGKDAIPENLCTDLAAQFAEWIRDLIEIVERMTPGGGLPAFLAPCLNWLEEYESRNGAGEGGGK